MIISPPRLVGLDAQAVFLSNLLPSDLRQPRAAQARDVLEQMEAALRKEEMTFSNVVRTWFYLDTILDWYDEFNAVRNSFFKERNVFSGVVPASTGVGISNREGAAIAGALLAIRPGSNRVKVEAVPSPMQCSALNYRSAFSRAIEVDVPGSCQLLISGTASIDQNGSSLHRDDLDGQIAQTMTAVEAILKSRNMTWSNCTRIVAYFDDICHTQHLTSYCRAHGLPELPVTHTQATLCRKELLFEVELDAQKSANTL